ncbi:MAG TPA: hypothetical protein VKD72_14340 [Gemmataceae bacterium]|nr:hypothetical protein [Gemmataceae bacterium]
MSGSNSTTPPNPKRVVVWVQNMHRTFLMLQWHDPITGKRKSKSAETCNPVEAAERARDLEYELNHDLYEEPSRISWAKFREYFEAEYLPNVRPGTRKLYRLTMDHFEEICRPSNVASITERTISTFVRGLRERKGHQTERALPSTIVTRLRFLHGVLAWAADQDFLKKVPKFPTVSVPKKRPLPVATELFERLVEAASKDHQLQVFISCGWLAGLRLVETFELEWEESRTCPWVDLPRNRIWLPAETVKAVEDQWVPLDPILREALLSLPRHGRKVFHFTDGRPGCGTRLVLAASIGQRIIKLARRAGVRLNMRMLRRGFGSRYAGKVPAQVLQRLMRHSDITITMTYYANIDQAVEEAVLGDRRNTSRNKSDLPTPQSETADAPNPQENGT